jgi:hypothetical protein
VDDGYYVSFAGDDGFYCSSAGGNGLYVGSASESGVYVSNATNYGVYGNASSSSGGYFRNNTTSYYAAYAMNNQGTGATIPGLYVQGRGYATGGFTTYLGNGEVGHAIVSRNVEVISSGTAKLVDGQVVVDFEETFTSAVSSDVPVNVTLTPVGMPAGMLYLDDVSKDGFTAKLAEIPGLERGVTDVSFNWMAIGRKSGYEETPDIEAPDEEAIMAWDREQYRQAEAAHAIEFEQQMGTRSPRYATKIEEPEAIPASNPAAPASVPRIVTPEPVRTSSDPLDADGR